MLPSQRAFLQLENSHGGEISTQPPVPLPLSTGKDWHQKGSGLQRWAVFAPCDPQTATFPSLLSFFTGFTWKRDAASPSHPGRHKTVVLTCRKKSEGTRGTEGGAVTFDTGEKRAELSGAAEVREADVTPEKSTIVKGTGRAGKGTRSRGLSPAYRGTALALRSQGLVQRCPLLSQTYLLPLCCLEGKAKSPPCLQRHQTPLGFNRGSWVRALSALGSALSSPHWEDPCPELPLPWLQQAI